MKILFCNIASMKFYKGLFPGVDEPKYGGEYVLRTGDANEKYNFLPVQENNQDLCFGSVETKSTNGMVSNQLHIEKIEGVSRKTELAKHVLVVWCAVHNTSTQVAGWYKNAIVYRDYQTIQITGETGDSIERVFNIEAKAADCVLLPYGERNRRTWWVPRKRQTRSFGFGQANVWFAQEESAEPYIQQLIEKINSYHGENWLWTFPENGAGK